MACYALEVLVGNQESKWSVLPEMPIFSRKKKAQKVLLGVHNLSLIFSPGDRGNVSFVNMKCLRTCTPIQVFSLITVD